MSCPRRSGCTQTVWMHPDRLDITTPTPGPAFESCLDGAVLIAEKQCQPLSVIHPSVLGVVFIEPVFQELHVCKRWFSFYGQVTDVHGCCPSHDCPLPLESVLCCPTPFEYPLPRRVMPLWYGWGQTQECCEGVG